MKIRKRLNLNAVISLGAVIVIILSLVWSYQEDSKANRNMDLVEEIRIVAFERILLRDDYLLHGEERAKIQWLAKSETLRRLLDVADQRFTDSDERGLLQKARKDFDATHASFSSFMEKKKRKDPSSTRDFKLTETESLLISQLFLKAYSLTDSIDKLHVSTHHKLARVRERSIVIVVFFMFAGITVILVNSMILNRLLSRRMAALGKGIEIIGAGDLDYRIDAQGDDELSALALGANEMASKLKMSHTSVENLQQEIAERKEAEENLKQTLRLNQVLLDAFPCVALLLRPGTREIVASNAAAVKVGAVPGTFCFSTWGQREDPCPWCLAPAVWDTGKEQYMEVEAGGICWDAHWIPVSEDLYMHFAFDITDRKLGEKRIRESEEALRSSIDTLQALVNSSPLAIVTFDKDGDIGMWNQAAERMFGWRTEEVIGRPHPIVPEDKWEEFREFREIALGGGTFTGRELRRLRKDGSNIDISVSTAPLRDAAGSITSVMSIITDITERKRGEERERTLERQVQQAQKMEAVGRLAGGIAHDFNNLLTVITGYSELLLQKIGKESPMHGEAEEIRRAAARAAALTRQLLAFSRKQIIAPKVLDLNLLIANLGKMLVRLIGENIDLKTVHGKNLGRVKVDPGQFEQILVNMAVNARDAMEDGGTLLIETANVELDEEYCAQRPYQIHPGRFVRLAVSDTGCGMTEETSRKIYEPFFTTKATGKGTGLGLSMIYGAVKQSGGSIEAYSEVGKGTTFKIYLPRVEGEAVKPGKEEQPTVLPGGTETVLVVEDEEIVLTMCSRILGELGYKVLQARNGAEAIALAQGYGDRINLLLTDVVMPGMNGAELARQLVLHHPEMKVLFASGYTDDAISRHGVLDEGVSFLGKPYTPTALAKKVREVFDKA